MFTCFSVEAARIHGKIVDENQEALPFATLHIRNTSLGTTTNADGYFSLEVKPGTHDLVVQYVGYRSHTQRVEIFDEPVELNITLYPEVFELKEVVIQSNGEDPAYEVIRNTIKNRKDYLREVNSYQCDVYIKGLQRLDQAPKSILGIPINLDTGIVYLSESISRFSFKQPDKVREEMISSKVSGDNNAFSYNQASEMMFSFYENLIQVQDLNERGFISPIANNALAYYDYALDGTFEEDGYLINKISVIPKRKNDPVFSGKLYIVEDSWRIHSLDFLLTKNNQIEFVDSLKVNQVYAPVETGDGQKPWMMITQQFNFQFQAFGFVGNGYFIGVHSNYEIEPAFGKKFFTNELLSIKEEANLKDPEYWNRERPVPLTSIEKQDYEQKDSLRIIKESQPYLDSIDARNNRLRPSNLFISGYTYRNSFKKKSLTFDPLTRIFQYNTVEGLTPHLSIQYLKTFEDRSFYRISPAFRYGFSNQRFNAQIEALFYYNPLKFSYGAVTMGRMVEQFNPSGPIRPFINTVYTLLAERNYMKLFGKNFINYRHRIEIANGVMITGSVEYAQREPLFNTTTFSFKNQEETTFTPNEPAHNRIENKSFERHQSLIANISVRLRLAQKYITRPNQKIILDTKYPTITLDYQKGVAGILGSDINFDRVSANLSHTLNLKMYGATDLSLTAGTFLNTKALTFIDFKHFNGNRTIINTGQNNFQLLDYYFYSTDGSCLEGHLEHHFNGFIFNKIPFIRQLKWQAVSVINYLFTDDLPHYIELGAGIEHIFKVGRIDFYRSFQPQVSSERNIENSRWGIRFGIGF
ncbi:DUF5686 and carboxypeptidase regulatory-like domain-containing protein [soil metagenome]